MIDIKQLMKELTLYFNKYKLELQISFKDNEFIYYLYFNSPIIGLSKEEEKKWGSAEGPIDYRWRRCLSFNKMNIYTTPLLLEMIIKGYNDTLDLFLLKAKRLVYKEKNKEI
uniref:Uncharacterized protein n=1 Tax=viral metagenome TaxID=1070528 RepID=A0A6H1ZWM8_9ZZZZ